MQLQDLSKYNFQVQTKNLPINIYGLRIIDNDKNQTYDVVINHNGYCPIIYTEREQSNYNDYLSHLEATVINEFLQTTRIKNYSCTIEIVTNDKAELYHFLRSVTL